MCLMINQTSCPGQFQFHPFTSFSQLQIVENNMLRHYQNNPSLDYYFLGLQSHFPSAQQLQYLPSSLQLTPSNEHDYASVEMSDLEYINSERGSPCSITNYGTGTLVETSFSSHSHLNVYSPMSSSPSETSSARRKMDDLQVVKFAPSNQLSYSSLASESSTIESMYRATSPYSPEEKKERIEKYRKKRNLRNFNKKIQYECRKSLADSRPRVRGRFARNDATEKATETTEEDCNWISFLDVMPANGDALIISSSI